MINTTEFKAIDIETLAEAFFLHARGECETKLICKNRYGGQDYDILTPRVISNFLNKNDLLSIFEGVSEAQKKTIEEELINLEF